MQAQGRGRCPRDCRDRGCLRQQGRGYLDSRVCWEWKEASCRARCGSATGRALEDVGILLEAGTIGPPQCCLTGSQVGFRRYPWSFPPGLGATPAGCWALQMAVHAEGPVGHTSPA